MWRGAGAGLGVNLPELGQMLLTSSSQVHSPRGKMASNPLGVRAFGLTPSPLHPSPIRPSLIPWQPSPRVTSDRLIPLWIEGESPNQKKKKKTQGRAWTPGSTNWFCCVILTFGWWQLWCDYCVLHNHKECWVGNTSKTSTPLLKRLHPPSSQRAEFVPTQSKESELRCNRHSGAHLSSIQVRAAGILEAQAL